MPVSVRLTLMLNTAYVELCSNPDSLLPQSILVAQYLKNKQKSITKKQTISALYDVNFNREIY